jgi:hypothetical protein
MQFKSIGMAAVLSLASVAAAQGAQPTDPAVAQKVQPQDSYPHPELSSSDHWAGTMVLIISLGFFLPAAIIGPWIRRLSATDMPELHDREEQSALTASQHEPGHSRSR